MRKSVPRNGAAGCAAPTPLKPIEGSRCCRHVADAVAIRRARGKCRAGVRAWGTPAENGPMVCSACRAAHHEECPGGNWCDCQHEPPRKPPEPPVAWIRQG